jgi:hypothetical protein
MNTVLLCFDDKISTISAKKTRTEKSQEIKGFCRGDVIVLITHNVFIEYQLFQIKKLQLSRPTNNVHLSIKINHSNKVKLLYFLFPFPDKNLLSLVTFLSLNPGLSKGQTHICCGEKIPDN